VKCNSREIFHNPEEALPALAGYMTWFHRKLAAVTDSEERGELEHIAPWTAEFGSRIFQMNRPDVSAVQEAARDARRQGNVTPILRQSLEDLCGREFTVGDVTVNEITTDLLQERGGFSPVPTPSVPPVIAALQRDRRSASHVLALNAGGTSEQIGYANATSEHVHIENLQTRKMENAPCHSTDDFWNLHFPADTIRQLAQSDPERTTIVVGLAFPIQTFEDANTGRTDGTVIHFADKYDAPVLGPRNALEAASRKNEKGQHQPLIHSLRSFLKQHTGKRFLRISLAPNDTNTAEIAFCTSRRAEGRKTGGLVCGTGFNVCSGDTNFEAGHYVGRFPFSMPDRIANALEGGGANDVECLCCGKILGHAFLVAIQNCGLGGLTEKIKTMSEKERDIFIFSLAYNRAPAVPLDTVEEYIARTIATAMIARAETSLALMLAAIHSAKGTEVIFGEGSYVRKEDAFKTMVNRKIRAYCPHLQSDLLAIEPLPVSFASEEQEHEHGNNLAASFVGSVLYGHGQNLLETERLRA